jgi:hypothetical protein
MVAHVAGLPLEEIAPSMAGGVAAAFVARSWVMTRLRKGRGTRRAS